MTCEHRFVAFPGSFSRLFCERCGEGRDAFGGVRRESSSGGRRRTRARVTDAAPLPGFSDDPDRGGAEQILSEKRALASLEARLRDVVSAAGLDPGEAETLVAEGLKFGDELDLDHFGGIVNQAAARQPSFALSDAEQ